MEEQTELFSILKKVKLAIENAFHSDWMNYAFLGNEFRHLHAHIIPRYEHERVFAGVVFKDERWGHNYLTDHSFQTPPELLAQIRAALLAHLPSH